LLDSSEAQGNHFCLSALAGVLYYQGFVVDITAKKSAQKERDFMETQLRQARKLESVGHLAADMAHEINTPNTFLTAGIGEGQPL
jgi:signal transduction histidine kinase